MKNLSIILLVTLLCMGKANAQDIRVIRNAGVLVDDLTLVLYVGDHCGNIVGISDPIPVNWSGGYTFDYSNITWFLDPDPCGTSFNWTFMEADLYNCIGSPSTGSTSCTFGNYDFAHLVSSFCPGPGNTCFEYSSATCTGTAGIVISADMSSADYCNGTSTLNIYQ